MEATVDEVVDELIADAESSISHLADQIAWRHAASISTTQTKELQSSLLQPLLDFDGPDARLTSLWQSDGAEATAMAPQPASRSLVSMQSSQGRALLERPSEVDLVVTELVVEASTAPSAAAAGADQGLALGTSQAEPLAKQDSAWSDAVSGKHAEDGPLCEEDSLLPAYPGMSALLEPPAEDGSAAQQWQRNVSSGTAPQSARHQQQQRLNSPAGGLDRASASMLLDVDMEPEAAFAAASALEQGQLRAGPSRVDAGTGPDPGQRRRSKLQALQARRLASLEAEQPEQAPDQSSKGQLHQSGSLLENEDGGSAIDGLSAQPSSLMDGTYLLTAAALTPASGPGISRHKGPAQVSHQQRVITPEVLHVPLHEATAGARDPSDVKRILRERHLALMREQRARLQRHNQQEREQHTKMLERLLAESSDHRHKLQQRQQDHLAQLQQRQQQLKAAADARRQERLMVLGPQAQAPSGRQPAGGSGGGQGLGQGRGRPERSEGVEGMPASRAALERQRKIEAAEGELRKLLAQEQQLFTSLESAEEQRQHQLHALECRRAAAASRSRRWHLQQEAANSWGHMEPGSESEQQQPHRPQRQQQQQAAPAALGQPTATSKRVYNETLAAQQAARREAARRQQREQESAARTERRRRQQAYDQAIKARFARAQARRSTVDELARLQVPQSPHGLEAEQAAEHPQLQGSIGAHRPSSSSTGPAEPALEAAQETAEQRPVQDPHFLPQLSAAMSLTPEASTDTIQSQGSSRFGWLRTFSRKPRPPQKPAIALQLPPVPGAAASAESFGSDASLVSQHQKIRLLQASSGRAMKATANEQ